MSHRVRWWVLTVLAAGVAAAEWLRQPAPEWPLLAWAACLAAAVTLFPLAGWRARAVLAGLVGLAGGLTLAQRRLDAIEHRWSAEREARVAEAFRRLQGDLHAALHRTERLAAAAAAAGWSNDRRQALRLLARLVPAAGPEMGVVLLEPDGTPWAWAGRPGVRPRARGDSIASRVTGYYVALEARRHSPDGRTAVATLLIWAHAAVPDRGRSLAELFRERTDVGLKFHAPGATPQGVEVFEYVEPTTAGPRLLFSVQPVPLEQGEARELASARASRAVTWLVLLTFALALAHARRPTEWYLLLPYGLWLGLRAPVGAALGVGSLFSPATFFRPVLGPITGSAGALALAGTLLTMAGVWLWRTRRRRSRLGLAVGLALLVVAPYIISALGRGITPPASGVSVGLWLTWQLTLLVSVSALIVPAAALFRGDPAAPAPRWRSILGVVIALAASVIGVLVWSPRGGWPEWYPLLWTPALLLVVLPTTRWGAIGGIALVAGSSAALVTWGAELAGKLEVAHRDVTRLGAEPDPLAVPLLEQLADTLRQAAAPRGASEMYALWRAAAVAEQGYPAHLALWTRRGTLQDELPLDSLDLPPSLLSALVRELPARVEERVVSLVRTPGVHYVLLLRTGPDQVMTTSVGPRSGLVAPGRVGRLLKPARHRTALYRLTLAPPGPEAVPRPARLRWRREGWLLRSEYPLELPGGMRVVHAAVDLRGPLPLFVRGALVVLLDIVVLALLWSLAEYAAGARPPRPRWRNLARSFRMRLAATLAAFFIVPAVGFAAWGFVRLDAEAERSRDLLITQALRDAVLTAGGVLRGDGTPPERLKELSRRIDADLALYRGGRLVGSSTEVLADLGIVPQLLDPVAFETLALAGELEVTRDGTIPRFAERVGYRVIQPGAPREIAVLATPQLAGDSTLGMRQLDLALVLLLATLVGVAAAVAGANRASRALSRPVAELRRSALALGRGDPMPHHSEHPPLEFEPVFGAFERMAADIRASQGALEAARRRTAAVLATVATGVVGLDPAGRVLIANRQAQDLLGTPLPEGDPFLDRLGPEWTPLAVAVRQFLRDPAEDASAELEVGGRRLTLQLASLGPDVRGVVVALNDVTDLSRAERVLAWGEMARQVAHEIKNPLTPMRLGMQHLRRVFRDRRADFERTLEETSARILGEIDRLDTIARAFSRFGAPADERQPLDRLSLAPVVGEVVQLYRLAEEGCTVRLVAEPEAVGAGRPDEVKEVVVNLLENARTAGARTVTVTVGRGLIRVADDGAGISAELLPRIFEPRFSTTTSGSGLGLAIVRRLVEGWGGSIEVESEPGRGTTVTVRLAGGA